MLRRLLLFVFAAFLLAACSSRKTTAISAPPVKWSYADILALQLDPAQLPNLRLAPSHLFSSSDPTGDNNDWAEFVNSGEGGWETILDAQGPGYLSRAWFAGWVDNARKLRVFVDGAQTPTAEFTFADWFYGEKGPLIRTENFCAYSYLPIPYNQRLRIEVEAGKPGGRFYFQFNIARLPEGSSVETVGFPLLPPRLPGVAALEEAWRNAAKPPPPASDLAMVKLAPRAEYSLPEWRGPATIQSMEISPSASLLTNPAALARFLRDVLIEICWDGEKSPSVLCPIGDFCGQAGDWVNASSLAFGAEEGRMFNRFPMPYAKMAKATFRNQSGEEYDFKVGIRQQEGAIPPGNGYFHAAWNLTLPRDVGPRHPVLRTKGRGRVAGLVLAVGYDASDKEHASWWMLEGDEQIRVDDEILPGWRGTGLEDTFNGGWYYRDVIANPLTGLLRKIPYDAVQYRVFTLDAPSFTSSIDFDFERGGQNNDPVRMETTVFYYMDAPRAAASRLPTDAQKMQNLRPLPKLQWMRRVGQFEALQDEAGVRRVIHHALATESNKNERARLELRKLAGQALDSGWDAVKANVESLLSPALAPERDLLERAFTSSSHDAVLIVYAQPGVEAFLDGEKIGTVSPSKVTALPIPLQSGAHVIGFRATSTVKSAWLHAQLWSGGKVLASTGTDCRYTMDPPEDWGKPDFDVEGWNTYLDRSLGAPGPDASQPGPPLHVVPGLVGRSGNIVRGLEGKAKAVAYRFPFTIP